MGCRLSALLIGYKMNSLVRQLLDKGFDTVFVADHEMLEHYNPETYARVIADVFKNLPGLFLLGYTYLGMEAGPAVATRLGLTLVSNCAGVELFDGNFVLTRPMYGGRVHVKLEARNLPLMISIQRGALPILPPFERAAAVVPLNVGADVAQVATRFVAYLEGASRAT